MTDIKYPKRPRRFGYSFLWGEMDVGMRLGYVPWVGAKVISGGEVHCSLEKGNFKDERA